MSSLEITWLVIGFVAQGLFTARFLVQWIASERKGESIIPVAFWYFSLSGGLMLLSYAIYKQDPVFITGQSFGVIVYTRNLVLVSRQRQAKKSESSAEPANTDDSNVLSMRDMPATPQFSKAG